MPVRMPSMASDVTLLCLPDDAARESVSLLHNAHTRMLDTSTAHRTHAGWAYGFPELSAQHREAIIGGRFVAVPGCHASGFIALITPLVSAGLLSPDTPLSCHSITGYSGGGKRMIAQYEAEQPDSSLISPQVYGFNQRHKHLPEMQAIPGLRFPRSFPLLLLLTTAVCWCWYPFMELWSMQRIPSRRCRNALQHIMPHHR